MKIYQVDAFTDRVFSGNPAAIVPLEEWLEDGIMQQIAQENNLSETAFFVKQEDGSYRIRWFTPQTEVDLCGHATLAAAHVLFKHPDYEKEKPSGSKGRILFQSHSGELTVEKRDGLYRMNFPSNPPERIPVPKLLPDALGSIPLYTGVNTDLLVLLPDEETVRSLVPDMQILKRMEVRGIIVTAASQEDGTDFVSRFFAPSVGIDEDPVTGSAHTVLAPFWAGRLGKNELKARQISERGGDLECILKENRVEIGGDAVTYLTGEFQF